MAMEAGVKIMTDNKYGVLRQQWISSAAGLLRPRFTGHGYTIPANLRISIGWPKGAKGRKGTTDTVGACHPPEASADGHYEVFISPILENENRIVGVLAHELVHAAVGTKAGHGPVFRNCATAIGLVGKMTSTEEGEEFKTWVTNGVITKIGPYPAAPLHLLPGKKQGTRLLKCACPTCGYPVRITHKWLASAGPPICPTDDIEMEEALKE